MLSFAKGTADHRDNASSKQTWPLPDLLIILDCAAKQTSHWQQSAPMGKAGSISGGGRDTDARGKGTGSTILYRLYSAVVSQPQLEVPHTCNKLEDCKHLVLSAPCKTFTFRVFPHRRSNRHRMKMSKLGDESRVGEQIWSKKL